MRIKYTVENILATSILVVLFLMSCVSETEPEIDSDLVVVTQDQRFDYLTWKIEAANGTWHFEIENLETGKPGSGFSSAIDREGNDWIGNDCKGIHEWRGWPNFSADGFGHPCRGGGGASQWVDANNDTIIFQGRLEGEHLILESWNDNYTVRYHFFPGHAAIEVVEANEPYAFLWEGPVAGELDIFKQNYVLQDGKRRNFAVNTGLGYLEPEFGRNFPSPFFYFLDEDAKQVVYIGAKGQSDGGDEGWTQPGNMVIFSFGREDDVHALTGTNAVSVFGFLDKEIGHENISSYINEKLNDPF